MGTQEIEFEFFWQHVNLPGNLDERKIEISPAGSNRCCEYKDWSLSPITRLLEEWVGELLLWSKWRDRDLVLIGNSKAFIKSHHPFIEQHEKQSITND